MSENEAHDYLVHYGVKGMKWGKRKAKSGDSSSGLRSTLKRATINRLESERDTFKALRDRDNLNVRGKAVIAINRMSMGKKFSQKFYNHRYNQLDRQANRLKNGEANVIHKINAVRNLGNYKSPRVQKKTREE